MKSILRVIIIGCALLHSSACAESEAPRTGHMATFCFYEMNFQITDEARYERFLESKARIENEFYRGPLVIRPLSNGSSIYFAVQCESKMRFLRTENKIFLRESSVNEYRDALTLDIRRME